MLYIKVKNSLVLPEMRIFMLRSMNKFCGVVERVVEGSRLATGTLPVWIKIAARFSAVAFPDARALSRKIDKYAGGVKLTIANKSFFTMKIALKAIYRIRA